MKFSIIVPVYNVEKYLNECIDSILKQTFNNYEIVLIDDGSTDKSSKICDSYKEKNPEKIIVIHKENGGLSDARNSGIKISRGEYLIFIDSDDYICDDYFLEKINALLSKKDIELLIYGNKKYYEKNKKYKPKMLLKSNLEEVDIELLINQNYFKACAWDKVIKRKILIEENIFFPIGRFSEDIEWCAKLLKKINLRKIAVLNENIYVYRQRENSISKKVNEKNVKDIYEMIKKEIEKSTSEKANIVNSYLAYEYSILLGWISTKKISKELRKKIFDIVYILDYDLSKKVKIVNKLINILRN